MPEVPQLAQLPQLIVGLGNPGSKYENTRHNVGFLALDRLSARWQIRLAETKKFQGFFGEGMSPAGKIRLLKPTTYMNLSGQSIRAVVDWYKLPPESVMVIYDDMDLPVGRLRIRLSGSAGGQNGMKSAIARLGTQQFPRLRIGIGSAKSSEKDAVSHVLGTFAPSEKGAINEVLDLTVSAIELSLKQGVEKAMSLYNNQIVEPKS
ncbi:aminoacyl-tRNA hydrolase [Cyanobacteria bacterium FACHB-63]|nr:aminoacyl-tRNA hydrolase [Cyanobacteria bacterium FACHB-63]